MFLNPTLFKKMMKEAYKGAGITVALKPEHVLHIAGWFWQFECKLDFIPKETLGDLYSLIGTFPSEGEAITVTENETQQLAIETCIIPEKHMQRGPLAVTNTLQIGKAGKMQRILQSYEDGEKFIINNVFIDLINTKKTKHGEGETLPDGPFYGGGYGVLWRNNVSVFRGQFRADETNQKLLEAIEGKDIIPE